MAKENTAEKVLELARGEIGASGGDKYIDYYNQLTGIGLPHGAAWCAAWVTWVMRHAGVPAESVLNYKGCATASEWFEARGRFRSRQSGYIPKPGDIIMYEWDPEDEGTAADDGDDHTGIVEYVKDGKVYTIEGNNGGKCCRDWWSLTNPYISGYCVPLYNLVEQPREDEGFSRWEEYFSRHADRQAAQPVSGWAEGAVAYCRKNGLMNGDREGGFRPQSYVTRQELAQALKNMLERL